MVQSTAEEILWRDDNACALGSIERETYLLP